MAMQTRLQMSLLQGIDPWFLGCLSRSPITISTELSCPQNYIIIIIIIIIIIYYSGDQIENEMGWACSTYEGNERCIQDFGRETWGKATTWQTQA
jgi:hypothetical protein